MRLRFYKDEWWPYYGLVRDGERADITIDVPPLLASRLFEVDLAFREVQGEIAELARAEEARLREQASRFNDIQFVRKQRPWWSKTRAAALVDSRKRSGKPLRSLVAA